MQKFNIGDFVQIKQNFPFAGYIGIITSYSKKTHTYSIHFDKNQKHSFPEEALEQKTV
ncbi:hypothetical protein [Enterococcus sp. DIV0756]|uniref:hypothetical protein n=1 Tax=Enterococcus sp. DIV0756 TaxID=2774636 RepID=UPI003F24030D